MHTHTLVWRTSRLLWRGVYIYTHITPGLQRTSTIDLESDGDTAVRASMLCIAFPFLSPSLELKYVYNMFKSLVSISLETFCRKSKDRQISIFVLSASMLCIYIPHAPWVCWREHADIGRFAIHCALFCLCIIALPCHSSNSSNRSGNKVQASSKLIRNKNIFYSIRIYNRYVIACRSAGSQAHDPTGTCLQDCSLFLAGQSLKGSWGIVQSRPRPLV